MDIYYRFTVIARDGAKVVVQSDRGIQYFRNVQDVKRVPAELESSLSDENDEMLPTVQDASLDDNPEHIIMRPQRVIQKPNRFKDMVLYSIFR